MIEHPVSAFHLQAHPTYPRKLLGSTGIFEGVRRARRHPLAISGTRLNLITHRRASDDTLVATVLVSTDAHRDNGTTLCAHRACSGLSKPAEMILSRTRLDKGLKTGFTRM